jgi:hypothetical protein
MKKKGLVTEIIRDDEIFFETESSLSKPVLNGPVFLNETVQIGIFLFRNFANQIG